MWLEFFLFFRNIWQNLAWPRLLTRPRLTFPTSQGRRTCTSPISTMLHPLSLTWRVTPLTPASLDPTSWETPSSSTSIIPSSSWWRTTWPSPSSTLAEWSGPRGTSCVMSYNVCVLNCPIWLHLWKDDMRISFFFCYLRSTFQGVFCGVHICMQTKPSQGTIPL